ncbi:MAG: hypothetical protein RLZ98_2832 [Pseudomonadota bacterium]|jgi:putative colanic acid biosynthesis UDP-glucose lipid carrier transferase
MTTIETFEPSPQLSAAADATAAAPARWSRRVAADLVGLLDATAVVAGAFLPALIITQSAGIEVNWGALLQVSLITAIVASVCLHAWNSYDVQRMHDFPLDTRHLLSALVIAMLAVLGLGLPFAPNQSMLWIWYSVWLSASFVLLLGSRIVARSVLAGLTAAGRFDTRVAIYGAGPIARRAHDYLETTATGIRLVGVYDDRVDSDRIDPEGLAVAGVLADLIAAGRRDEIDQVVIALPQNADNRMADIVGKLEQLPISVHIVTHMASDLVHNLRNHKVSAIGPVGMLDVKARPLSDWAPIVKRLEDYVLGTVFAVAALPLCLLIALAIRLDSAGPALFVQRRHGLNKRIIPVFKFRTMTVMEDAGSVNQATRADPRVTRVGRMLRRTSLDELPQLLNVLRGEMSLVGPRPHALVHDEQWGEMLETYANRHQVKPGITGLAQVSGFRGQLDSPEKIKSRVEQDLAYIRNWSLWLDIRILLRTVVAVLTGKNAY